MHLQSVLGQFIGSNTGALPAQRAQGVASTLSNLTGSLPGARKGITTGLGLDVLAQLRGF